MNEPCADAWGSKAPHTAIRSIAVRPEHALELLHRGAAPTHMLARATGFEDPRNFRRAFKRWTGGALPSGLRR